MVRVLTVMIMVMASGCATKPIFSSDLLIKSAREDLESANDMAEDVKKTFRQYIAAHKYMLKTRSLGDKDKMRELHSLMKNVRTQGQAVFELRKSIHSDVKVLETELEKTPSVAEGSETYKKVEPQLKVYGLGQPHPGLKTTQQAFESALKSYTGKLSEHSGYLTDSASLKGQFDRQLSAITARLNAMADKASGETALVNMISKIKLQLSDLESRFSGELPDTAGKVLLFPNMISYSVMDRLSAVGEQLDEIQKKIP